MKQETNITFPVDVINLLQEKFQVSEEDALSEIYFATARVDKTTGKYVFKDIHYEIEDDEDDLVISIHNTEFFVSIGEDYYQKGNFKTPFDFEDDTVVIINKLEEIVI